MIWFNYHGITNQFSTGFEAYFTGGKVHAWYGNTGQNPRAEGVIGPRVEAVTVNLFSDNSLKLPSCGRIRMTLKSYVWIFGSHLLYLLGKSVEVWPCCVIGSRNWDFKRIMRVPMIAVCLMVVEQNVRAQMFPYSFIMDSKPLKP